MIKVKRNRLKIFESLAPDCEEQSFINYQSHKKLTEGLSKVNLNSCILNEKLVETGSNSLLITLPYHITEEIVYSICSFYGEISYIKTTISENETKKFTSISISFYDVRSAVFCYQELEMNMKEDSEFSVKFTEEKKEYYEKYFLKIVLSKDEINKEKLQNFLHRNAEIYKISTYNNELIIHLFNSKDYLRLSFILEKLSINSKKVQFNSNDLRNFKSLGISLPKLSLKDLLSNSSLESPKEVSDEKNLDILEKESTTESISSSSTSMTNKEYVIIYDQEYSGIRKRNTPDIEKQKYVISVEKIINNVDLRTTLMVKNIPNTISQVQLLEQFNLRHKGSFNFFYLPIDFKTKLNVGYAFINFKEPSKIVNFFLEFNCKKWVIGNEKKKDKVCFLSYARIQGLRCILDHFKRSSIMKQIDEKLKPMVFN